MTSNTLKHLFVPNQVLSKSAAAYLAAAQIALFTALWFLSGSRLLPNPAAILSSFDELLFEKGMLFHLFISAKTVLTAMVLTVFISLSIAYASTLPVFRGLGFVASKLRFVPLAGLTFMFTIVFGGEHIKMSLLTYGMTVFFLTNMLSVVLDTKKSELDHARLLGMSEWRATYEVIVLGKFDQVIETARQNFAIAWTMLTFVEGVSRSEGGIGVLLNNSDKHFNMPEMYAMLICIFVVGLAIDYLFGVIKALVCPYAVMTLERN